MRTAHYVRLLVLCASFGFTTYALAQDKQESQIATDKELYEAVVTRSNSDEADRAAIRDVLKKTEVREIAERYGLELAKASEGVTVLNGPELNRLAQQANQLNEKIAGGDLGDIELILVIVLAIVTTVILLTSKDKL